MIKFLQRMLIMLGLGGCVLSIHFEWPHDTVEPTAPAATAVDSPPPAYVVRWEIPKTEEAPSLPLFQTAPPEPVAPPTPIFVPTVHEQPRRFRPFRRLRAWIKERHENH